EVVARAIFRIEGREGVAGAEIKEVGGGIVGGGLPHAGAADAPGIVIVLPSFGTGLPRGRNRKGAPRELAGFDVEAADPAPGAGRAAGRLTLYQEFTAGGGLDGQRGAGERLGFRRGAGLGVRRRRRQYLPDHLAGVPVERDEARIIGGKEYVVAVHGE